MDSNNVLKNIKYLLNNSKERVSIFVDGDWGIGKTFLIKNQLFEKQDNKYELKYISFFGYNSLREIENELLMQFVPFMKSIDNIPIAGKAISDISKKFIGVDLNEYINCFSIDNIPEKLLNGKKIVLCFDDIERKSDEIHLKDLLGLIERSSHKFDVIVISNLLKLKDEDRELFNSYREKVLDYEFCITSINDNVLREILRSRRKDEDVEYEDAIINIYKEDFYSNIKNVPCKYNKTSIKNIRIYIRFIDLLCKLENEVSMITGGSYNKLDYVVIEASKDIIYNYWEDKYKITSSYYNNIDKQIIMREIKKIFYRKEYDISNIKEYLKKDLEIRKDISLLWNLYKLDEESYEKLIEKINEKIQYKNLEYFINQKQVISMMDAFIHLNKGEVYKEKLFYITKLLYRPTLNVSPNVYNEDDWSYINKNFSIELECNEKIKKFIEKINISNRIEFNKYVDKEYEKAISKKDIGKLKDILKHKRIDDLKEFEKVFTFAFDYLINNYDDEYMLFIESLIENTKSEVIYKYFTEKGEKEKKVTIRKKYEYFDQFLSKKMYLESITKDD